MDLGLDLAAVKAVQRIGARDLPMARVVWQSRCTARHILPQIARRYREYSGN